MPGAAVTNEPDLVSWNVAGRKSRLDEQAERVLGKSFISYVSRRSRALTAAGWTERLADAGLVAVVAPLPPGAGGKQAAGRAHRGARARPRSWGGSRSVPWPERVLCSSIIGRPT